MLIGSLRRNLAAHEDWEKDEGFDWPAWQALKLANLEKFRRQNQELMQRYKPVIDRETRSMLQNQFREGHSSLKNDVTDNSFFGVNTHRNEALIADMLGTEEKVESAALRMMDDVYRQTVNRTQLAMSAGAVTLPKAIDMATRDFLDKGINCIVYKNGTRHNIADYVQMALQTTAVRSYLQGEAQKRQEFGVDTVLVSQYGACSETCLPWQGRVYIDDVFVPFTGERRGEEGKSREGNWYPLLSTAVKGGLFHPNCRHTLSTWYEGISTKPKPMDKEKIRKNAKLEAKQRSMEREVRKWKRLAEGTQDPEKRKEYRQKVRESQKKLREFIAGHSDVLRRDYWRESTHGVPDRSVNVRTNVDNTVRTDKLTDEDRRAIDTYKSSQSYILNDKLRRGERLDPREEEIIHQIDRAIEKLPIYNGEVYRSIQSDMIANLSEFNQEHIPGQIVVYSAFTSSSTMVYDESMDIQLVIQSRNGRDMREYNPMEKEIVFPRESQFFVVKREGNRIWMKEL